MGYSRPQGIPAYAGPDGASNCGAPGAWAGSWECDRSVGIPPCLHQRAPEPLYSLCAKLRVRCSMHSRMHILQMMLTTCEACHAAVFLFLLCNDCQHQLHVGCQFGVEGTFQKGAESGRRRNKRKCLATTTPYRQVCKKKLNLGRELA